MSQLLPDDTPENVLSFRSEAASIITRRTSTEVYKYTLYNEHSYIRKSRLSTENMAEKQSRLIFNGGRFSSGKTAVKTKIGTKIPRIHALEISRNSNGRINE